MNTSEFVALLESHGCAPHKSASGYAAKCPAHEDHNPSLSVTTGTDGRILLRCHAGCPTDAIISALGVRLSDLFAEKNAPAAVRPKRPCKAPPDLPQMQEGTREQMHALADLRRVSPDAVALAIRRGLVRFGLWKSRPSWFVTDSARRNCQARFLLAIPVGIFWQCAAWRAELDTRLQNERAGE